ncbi:MAG: DUF4388 domain-containing protein [Gemmatimonadales bacterium]
MAIEGPLKELGIHDVFQLLDLSRKTGKLTVTSKLRHNSGSVYFENGVVVYAEIESNPHLLGKLLVRSGKISEADLNRARDMQLRGDERRMGEILVAIGAIAQRELEHQVRFQIEEVVFELLSWREGYFSFVEGELGELPSKVAIPTESLLMEGARRIDEWSLIQRRVPSLDVVPAIAPLSSNGDHGRMDLLPAEWEVLTAVDGERDVRQVAGALGRSEFEVAKIIFGLESAGILVLRSGPRVRRSVAEAGEAFEGLMRRAEEALAAGEPGTARRYTENALSDYPQEPTAFMMLGQIDLAEHRAVDAEEHLRRSLRMEPMLAKAHRLLGNALAMQGRHQEAVEWWRRWLKLEDDSEERDREVVRVMEALDAVAKLDNALGAHND